MKNKARNGLFALLSILVFSSVYAREEAWVNTAGRPFSARLTDLNDTHATFVMTDGTINVLAVTALHPDSQATARRLWELPVVPAVIRATYELNLHYLRRIRQLYLDGRLDAGEYADARRRLLNGFKYMYRKHHLPEDAYSSLERRLLNAASARP